MSSTWLFKTPQMNEPGKEILLREALVYHLRSSRDRQMLASLLEEARPLEDIISLFASFYLYYYQGLRLLAPEHQSSENSTDSEIEQEELRLLELEIRQILGDGFRELIDIKRLVSEFIVTASKHFESELSASTPPETVKDLVKEFLQKIPTAYSPNTVIDFINGITGWDDKLREELYAKASGLKESALTLRDELMREREEEVIEISILKETIIRLFGELRYLSENLTENTISDDVLTEIAKAVWTNLRASANELTSLRLAHQIRIELLDFIFENIDSPTTISQFENELALKVVKTLVRSLSETPASLFSVIAHLTGLPVDSIRTTLRLKSITDASEILNVLAELETEKPSTSTEIDSSLTKEELEEIERSLHRLEKIERTLEGPVKGILKARGLRASELEKVTIDILTKAPKTLIAIEQQVLEELNKKLRLPTPEEIKQLLEIRRRVQSGELGNLEAISATDMSQKRIREETITSIKYDLAWYLMIQLMPSVARVVESYIRSKQDLLRMRALLKSIYEDTEMEIQYLREEILIDLLSHRIFEMKCVHVLLDASTICAWMHARLSNKSLEAARDELTTTASPVFEGVADTPLAVEKLEFDNYAIAYDIMHRFLKNQKMVLAKKEELALEAKIRERELILSKRKSLDPLNFVYTKAHTVFRAISRVGTKGLEWGTNDEMKCSNLLEFYIRQNRGRPICRVCGATPKDGVCLKHGKGNMTSADDIDNLSLFIMQAITDIKTGLMGSTAEPFPWEKARSLVQRELSSLRSQGRLTSKTNFRNLLPGEINHAVGPRIGKLIGKYFNESLRYAAKRAGLA